MRVLLAVIVVAVLLTLAGLAWRALAADVADVAPPQAASAVAAGAEPSAGAAPGSHAAPPAAGDDAAAAPARVEAALGSAVLGRLLRAQTPLADVEVRALRPDGGSPARDAVRTRDDGSFELALSAGVYELACTGAAVPRGYRACTVALGAAQRIDVGALEVPAAAALAGRVLDESEQAVAGALVFVTGSGLPRIEHDTADVPAVPGAVFTRTGADGRFNLGDLRDGRVTVVVEHERFVPSWSEATASAGATADCGDLLLFTLAPLHGVVVDPRGQPVAAARVVRGGAREHSPLQPRRGAVTDAHGAFTLPCFGDSGDLTVFADGFEPLATQCERDERAPLRVTLQSAHALHGRVRGVERGGVLTVGMPPDEWWRGAQWVHDVIHREHRVGADGTFRVEPVPRGRWLVAVRIPGVGSSTPRPVDVPLTSPLELELDVGPATAVAVRVVDDLGAPVPDATVVRVTKDELPTPGELAYASGWFGWAEREQSSTDATGRTVVHVPAGQPMLLAARSPRHLVATAVAAAGALPENADLVLTRGATIEGELDDARLGRHLRFHVECVDPADPWRFLAGSAVDRDGRFRLAPLPPGKARVELLALDGTTRSTYAAPVQQPVPCLGGYDSVAPELELELQPGETRTVRLTMPAFGEITGRVLVRGAPLADVIVYGRAADGNDGGRWRIGDEDEDEGPGAHELWPHVRTDADGRFRFLVARAGAWHLRARTERSAQWSPPHAVDLPARDARRSVDLVLSAGSIRGRWPLGDVAPRLRGLFEAQLYPLAEAHHDAFSHGDWSTSRSWRAPKRALDRAGVFVFEGVPEGPWVLRIVESGFSGPVLWQRVVTTARDEQVDLGAIEPPARVAARVRTGVAEDVGVWLAQAVPGNPDGLFVATIGGARDGVFGLGMLTPGRHLLRPFRRGPMFAGDWGVRGTALGAPVTIEVHDDGRTTPDVVWPDGIR